LTTFIYLTLTTINLAVPLGFFCVYMYLSMKFAGFPYASKYAIKRLNKV